MRLSGFLPVFGRRLFVAAGAAALVMSSLASAQTPPPPTPPPAQQPAAPAPPKPDPLLFKSDVAWVLFQVKADKTADFESAIAETKAGLAKSAKPELQAHGVAMKLLKLDAPAGPEGFIYFIVSDPADKTVSYDLIPLLYDSGAFERPAAELIYNKLKDAITGIRPWPMLKIGG